MDTDRFELGIYSVDLVNHEATRDGDRISLSRNEVALLRFLLQHDGVPISKEQLHVDVFGYAPTVVSRAADFAVHRLRRKLERDPSAPEHLLTVPGVGYRLVVRAEPVAPVAPAAAAPSLPAETTSFVGRERALAEVIDALASRLVTVVGPGGAGKTRMALRVARQWHADGAGAVWFCDASSARDTGSLCSEVAAAVGSTERLGEHPVDRMGAVLAGVGAGLLVADNLEQVVDDAATAVAAWLARCPQLRVLATSRERLRVPGERVVELGPLDLDDATALFAERARDVRPSFRPSDDAAALEALLEQLDGLPLAIELAAARSGLMSPRQILDRLGGGGALGPGSRGTPERQATIERAIAWSWDLLDAEERSALGQLAAFRGGFDLDDAESVVRVDRPVHAVVQALRDKSLVAALPAQGSPRFTLLHVVAAFAAAHTGDASACHVRHARWVVDRTTDAADRELALDQSGEAVLLAHHDDLVAAVDRLEALGTEPALLARAVSNLDSTWHRSSTHAAWVALVGRALAAGDAVPAADRFRLHLAHARSALDASRPDEAAYAACEAAVELAEGPEQVAHAHLAHAALLRLEHRFDASRAALDRARAALAGVPVGALHVRLENQFGNLGIGQGTHDEAHAAFRRALGAAERAGTPWLEPLVHLNLAVLFGWQGRARDQVRSARRALLGARELGERVLERRALMLLAMAESEVGRLDEAARFAADALTLCEADRSLSLACDTSVVLAGIELARGRLEDTERHVRRARSLADHVRAPWHRAYIDLWDALLTWARWGSPEEAATLLDRAQGLAVGHMPTAVVEIGTKQLAVRAHLEPDAREALEAEFRRLEEEAQRLGRTDLVTVIRIDRAHLALARASNAARRGEPSGPHLAAVLAELEAAAGEPMDVRVARVVLASAFAAADLEGDLAVPVVR